MVQAVTVVCNITILEPELQQQLLHVAGPEQAPGHALVARVQPPEAMLLESFG